MKIALATDHAGFELLRQLEAFLVQSGHKCKDFGPESLNPKDDYPDFIFPAAQAVASGECEVGIILGGSGQGEAMAANRVKGVRCAVYYGAAEAPSAIDAAGNPAKDQHEILRLSREHNNANMLSLAARFVSLEDAKQAINVWLGAKFSGDERHERRISKLDQPAANGAGQQMIKNEKQSNQPPDVTKAESHEDESAKAPKRDAVINDQGTLSVQH